MKVNLLSDNLIEQVKSAKISELENLSKQIREFLVDNVSQTGGHLSSNLGAVELTIALHKIYNTPDDKIIFDVGHQSYVHKILTGRASEFSTLRQKDGLSGFPKHEESLHDVYDTGHSSTSLSAALGMAAARDLSGDKYNVVAVIGDGSMTGGLCFEALNNIGASGKKLRIILNDNGMSISRNVGGLAKHLMKLRTSNRYLKTKKSIKSALEEVPVVGKAITGGLVRSRDKIKFGLLGDQGVLFEDLGVQYIGPIDGHNIKELVKAFDSANKIEGPTLVHVITKKGKGYHWSEMYPRKFHGIGAFDKDTGVVLKKSDRQSYSQVFGNKICEISSINDKVVAIAAAMGTATGLGKFYENFPDRYFDVGIAEQHAVIFASGMAMQGYIPVVAIYSSFLQRAFDQILEDVALHKLHVVFAIDRAGLVGADGETHQGQFDISYMNMIPGMTILTPADASQLEDMFEYAINECTGPVAIRYPRGESNSGSLGFDGNNKVIKEGKDVTILAVGTMLDNALRVSDKLASNGISTGVINISIVKPYLNSLSNIDSNLIVTLEDGILSGGFGEAFIAKNIGLKSKVINLGLPDSFISQGTVNEQLESCGLSVDQIVARIVKEIRA